MLQSTEKLINSIRKWIQIDAWFFSFFNVCYPIDLIYHNQDHHDIMLCSLGPYVVIPVILFITNVERHFFFLFSSIYYSCLSTTQKKCCNDSFLCNNRLDGRYEHLVHFEIYTKAPQSLLKWADSVVVRSAELTAAAARKNTHVWLLLQFMFGIIYALTRTLRIRLGCVVRCVVLYVMCVRSLSHGAQPHSQFVSNQSVRIWWACTSHTSAQHSIYGWC